MSTTRIWKDLTDEERLQIVERFNNAGTCVVGNKHDQELLEEHVPFFLDSVRYNDNELRLVIIPDSGGFIPREREEREKLYKRARIVCAPVIMPLDIELTLLTDDEYYPKGGVQ